MHKTVHGTYCAFLHCLVEIIIETNVQFFFWATMYICTCIPVSRLTLQLCLASFMPGIISALEVFFKNDMRYINSRFTYLLTYLLEEQEVVRESGIETHNLIQCLVGAQRSSPQMRPGSLWPLLQGSCTLYAHHATGSSVATAASNIFLAFR